ncbi:carcinoembryonic antigen-related cell adhesion molecule 21 [Engraulis encrasicolus]|uniref:carcinoembryonic antigen-related cell adhesion molecule 21 n=1 Tax=Engraulis encrasicolus TaxID=184585 RepID=UPI002FD5EFDA
MTACGGFEALLHVVRSQGSVSIEFVETPVLATAGRPAVFQIVTTANIFSTTWTSPGGDVIATWTSAGPVVNIGDYEGRVTLTATRFTIDPSQLRDVGNYSVRMSPSQNTGLLPNTGFVELRVFDAVAGVSLAMTPDVAVEGSSLSMRCSWAAGTQTSVAWRRGDKVLSTGGRITVSGGTLSINPARRDDTGEYSCTVSNPVSAQTTRASVTVYCESQLHVFLLQKRDQGALR